MSAEAAEAVVLGWLGKAGLGLLGIAAGVAGGWWTSRANIMGAVNARVDGLMGHLETEIDRLTTQHRACEANLTRIGGEVEQIRGELRQAKQTIDSMERLK